MEGEIQKNHESLIINHKSMTHNDEHLSLVIVGHVDHGKSTIIGRMLADTGALPDGKLEQVKENCRRNSKPFEYAFLLDALKDEQSQGITIDAARCFFKTEKRKYIIIDAPGHIEFLKNMVTGASRAEAALLVIDAAEGVQENSRRHGYMLSMLGIKQVSVLVNKMDLVNYNQTVFDNIVKEYTEFLKQIDVEPSSFIPVSGMEGDSVAKLTDRMPWYTGRTVLEMLDEFDSEKPAENRPFRMPVQGVYKFTKGGDDRRIIAGTIETGSLKVGDQVVFSPSGKQSQVKTIESFNASDLPETAVAGEAIGFTMTEQIYVQRGEIATVNGEQKPKTSSRISVNLFWLGKESMTTDKEYLFKLGTAKVRARLEQVVRVIDASTLGNETRMDVQRHDVAECILKLEKAVAFDLASDMPQTSRFVIVDDYEIAGGGIVIDSEPDKTEWVRDKVFLRNYKWEKSMIPREKRAEKYNQKPTMVLITGQRSTGKKSIAKLLEKQLFEEGKVVYFLGIGNVLYGVDADIKEKSENFREEHIRRMAEVSHLMLDSGVILIVTAIELTASDKEIISAVINPDQIKTVWVGEEKSTDISYDIHLTEEDYSDSVKKIKNMLQNEGIIFKPF